MQFDAATITEQNVTFTVIAVQRQAVVTDSTIKSTMQSFSNYFPGMPIVLMHQDVRNIPTYYGRRDIVNFLANYDVSQFPWERFTI